MSLINNYFYSRAKQAYEEAQARRFENLRGKESEYSNHAIEADKWEMKSIELEKAIEKLLCTRITYTVEFIEGHIKVNIFDYEEGGKIGSRVF